jgi:hypothetical protein
MTTTISGSSGIVFPDLTTMQTGQQAVKAWVNFNGTGTVAIRAGYNVASITDNGVGTYTVNFTTAMVDANYAFTTSFGGTNGTAGLASFDQNVARTVSAFQVVCFNSAGSSVDVAQANIAVFR